MTKFVISYCVIAFCCLVELLASIHVTDTENIDNQVRLIEEFARLKELFTENVTTKEPGSCQADEECLPGGKCIGKGLYGKVCQCFRGVSGDHCKTIDECIKTPPKCGDGNDVECSYDIFNKIPYCKCMGEGRRFDVKLKKCVDQEPCNEDEGCKNAGECEGETVKYCICKPGTYGDHCENIEECENNLDLCGTGTDVKCKYNYLLKRPFCHCINGTYRFDIKQKKCVERKQCNSQKECGNYGACTDKCQTFEPCPHDEYFEKFRSCHCVEGTSGEKCEIVDDCYNKVVDCGTGENVECKYRYVSGLFGSAYCTCTKNNQKFDRVSKLCKDCYCGEGSDSCEFKDGKKSCICKTGYLVNNGKCEKCDCGNNSTDCKFEKGVKLCSCEPGFTMGNYGVCTPTCSHSHQCENGGLCLQNICVCPTGTTGPYCERIYECENQLCGERKDVYCKYNTQTGKAYCQCQNNDAIYDPFDKFCKMCLCDSFDKERQKTSWESCEFVRGRKICHCKEGYAYQPKLGYCHLCNCGTNSTCEFDVNDKKKCHCDEGFKEWDGNCKKCDCGIHGICRFEDNPLQIISSVKVCACEQGYEDFKGTCTKCDCGPNGRCVFNSSGGYLRCDCDLGFSEDSKKCTFCDCGPDSKCSYKNKKKVCDCPKGYKDIKGYCKDIDECLKPESCPEPGMLCVNTQGSFRCECKPGYLYRHPDKNSAATWCEKQKGTQPDYSTWKIGYGVMSAGFILIFIALVLIIFKIRRNSAVAVRQPPIPLGTSQTHY